MHNTFTVQYIPRRKAYRVTSHNFPDVEVEAPTKDGAIDKLIRAITYIKDNDPARFKKNLSDRLAANLECGCGMELKDVPLRVFTPKLKTLVG